MKTVKRFIKRTISFCFLLFPINNKKIVFNNFNGKGYGDNQKYIAEEILKRDIPVKMIWLVKDLDLKIPPKIKKVKFQSLSYYYHLNTAKFIINNVRQDLGFIKRKQQVYIQTWHASMGFKKLEKDAIEYLDKSYIVDAIHDGKITDLMITNNEYRYKLFKKSFWYDGPILFKGLPRNDLLINGFDDTDFYNQLKIPRDKKIILYAPTFRDYNYDYIFDFFKFLKLCNEKFRPNKYIFLIKMHPNVENFKIEETDDIKDVSFYSDIQELLYMSDILITDFSSVFFDFLLMKKKTFVLTKDYEKYVNDDRGIYFDFSDLGINVSEDESELFNAIQTFDQELYDNRMNELADFFNFKENGKSSKYLVDYIIDKIYDGYEKRERDYD